MERGLTKQLGRVSTASGLLIVGEALVDDLSNGSIQALQLLVLRRHGGGT